MIHHKRSRILLALVATGLVLSLGTACKKKRKDHDKPKDEAPSATQVEPDFKPPAKQEDVLQIELTEITRKYLHDIRFDFDKSDIREDAKPDLEKDAEFLKKYPSIKIVIEGHCDERGSVEYNLALGERRAKAARNYLALLGIAEGRMTTVSYGKELPLDPGHSESAWGKNRRSHFLAVEK